jgi:hypothetical protein
MIKGLWATIIPTIQRLLATIMIFVYRASDTFDKFVKGGVCGRVVKVFDFKPLAPHRCGFESQQGLWNLSYEEAIQLAYGTSVVLLRCLFMPEIMHGRAPEVFHHQ